MDLKKICAFIFDAWKNERKMQFWFGISENQKFSVLSVEKYKKKYKKIRKYWSTGHGH